MSLTYVDPHDAVVEGLDQQLRELVRLSADAVAE